MRGSHHISTSRSSPYNTVASVSHLISGGFTVIDLCPAKKENRRHVQVVYGIDASSASVVHAGTATWPRGVFENWESDWHLLQLVVSVLYSASTPTYIYLWSRSRAIYCTCVLAWLTCRRNRRRKETGNLWEYEMAIKGHITYMIWMEGFGYLL